MLPARSDLAVVAGLRQRLQLLSREKLSRPASGAEAAGVVHLLGTEFRFSTAQALATRAMREGIIAEPRMATFVLNLPILADPAGEVPDWWADAAEGGGWLGALASHNVDQLRTMLGEFAGVSASLSLVADRDWTADGIRDRALGAFLGLAVGDAVGTTLEFQTRDTRPRLEDMVGGGPFNLPAGAWTDDTAMALALADSLAASETLDCRDLMDRFVGWWRNGDYSCTGHCFDIGITTRQALTRYRRTGDPFAGSTDPKSAGNGSLMRLSPVVLRFLHDRPHLVSAAADQCRTTHAANEAVDACRAFAEMLADAIAGAPRATLLSSRSFDGAPAIARVLAGSWRGRARHTVKSSGYVVDTLEAAIWSVARTADFRGAVLLAANLADDADTVAAVTGQLAGALYGLSGIPERWLDQVAWKDRLLDTAQRLLPEPVAQPA